MNYQNDLDKFYRLISSHLQVLDHGQAYHCILQDNLEKLEKFVASKLQELTEAQLVAKTLNKKVAELESRIEFLLRQTEDKVERLIAAEAEVVKRDFWSEAQANHVEEAEARVDNLKKELDQATLAWSTVSLAAAEFKARAEVAEARETTLRVFTNRASDIAVNYQLERAALLGSALQSIFSNCANNACSSCTMSAQTSFEALEEAGLVEAP